MTEPTWRIDSIESGALAWVYIRPHLVGWDEPAAAMAERGYTVTEESRNLVDDELGACLRYLAISAASPN